MRKIQTSDWENKINRSQFFFLSIKYIFVLRKQWLGSDEYCFLNINMNIIWSDYYIYELFIRLFFKYLSFCILYIYFPSIYWSFVYLIFSHSDDLSVLMMCRWGDEFSYTFSRDLLSFPIMICMFSCDANLCTIKQ